VLAELRTCNGASAVTAGLGRWFIGADGAEEQRQQKSSQHKCADDAGCGDGENPRGIAAKCAD